MICRVCSVDKELNEFYKDNRHPSGYKPRCKKCVNEAIKQSPKTKEYFLKNKKRLYQKHKEYRGKEKDKIYKKHREWCEKNKDRLRILWNNNRKKKISENINFRLKTILRSAISTKLRKSKAEKSNKNLELIGCSINELRKYLESKFKDGMSWSNYGMHGWHIDHIKPCDSFDLKDPLQQKECFHYSNLQPLWALENILKSNKI